jgi:hypothetical protein
MQARVSDGKDAAGFLDLSPWAVLAGQGRTQSTDPQLPPSFAARHLSAGIQSRDIFPILVSAGWELSKPETCRFHIVKTSTCCMIGLVISSPELRHTSRQANHSHRDHGNES